MIIVDTSVWIDHIRRPIDRLGERLLAGEIRHHQFVTGEIMLGSVANRIRVSETLAMLPQCPLATMEELLRFIEGPDLSGCGIGLVDAHLLHSATSEGDLLWTHDKRLAAQADRLGVAFAES